MNPEPLTEDHMKHQLIEKILERLADAEMEEQLSTIGLDIHSVVEDAVKTKLESMNIHRLLELL